MGKQPPPEGLRVWPQNVVQETQSTLAADAAYVPNVDRIRYWSGQHFWCE